MIGYLKGTVISIGGPTVILDVHGVGYEAHCTQASVRQCSPGEVASIVIYTDVREDSIRLYGFADVLEKQVFMLLMKVKGIGAKTASEIVSRIDKRELLRMIGAGDAGALRATRAMGQKTAERIVLELKDKVAEYALGEQRFDEGARGAPYEEALQALVALGFTKGDAERALRAARDNGRGMEGDSGEIVREALRYV